MKTKISSEVFDQIDNIMECFLNAQKLGVNHMSATIKDVGFTDIFDVFQIMKSSESNVTLTLPGEIGNEFAQIVYRPAKGFYIYIESESCLNLTVNHKQINLN